MDAQKGNPKSVDVIVTSVLIDTEHPALLATFGLEPFADPHERVNDVNIWHTKLERIEGEPLNIALTCLGDKGTTDSYGRTKAILNAVTTKSIYLVGTAAGRKDRTSICDVVVSSAGIMYYERGRMRESGIGNKPEYVYPKHLTKNEVIPFHTFRMRSLGWKDEHNSILRNLEQLGMTVPTPHSEPELHFDMIACGEKMVDETIMKAISDQDDSVRAAEMEGYGFARACDESKIDWLVIRGISDFGDRDDKENWKITATVIASSFLKIFLKHASQLPRQYERLGNSIYTREKIPEIVREVLREKSIDVTPVKFSLDLTINDLERICSIRYPAVPSEQIRKMVRGARATAFETKYAGRSVEEDERFIDIERWKAEFRSLLFHLGILELNRQRVINVGIGSCLEAEGVFDGIENFVGVDLSRKALEHAEKRCPKMQSIVNDAEDLHNVENSSQDVYISLRTYQSTLFDIDSALFEAYRVLRPGGKIIISIPHVFIDKIKGMLQGLLLPESGELDPGLPYKFVENIRRRLNLLNFDKIGIRTGMVEVYIYAERGR